MAKNPSAKKKKRTPGDLVLEMRGLEVARAHDGFFRGNPEAVVMVAVYALEDAPRIIARALWRFEQPVERLPTTVAARRPARPIAHPYAIESEAPVLLLAVGMEEDAGVDVRRVYSLLERTAHLHLWDQDEGGSHPSPLSLQEVAQKLVRPTRVRVLIDSVDLGMTQQPKDDYVGACAVSLVRARLLADHRMHLTDDEGKNDWTALLKVRTS
jgi:hypothetical protein